MHGHCYKLIIISYVILNIFTDIPTLVRLLSTGAARVLDLLRLGPDPLDNDAPTSTYFGKSENKSQTKDKGSCSRYINNHGDEIRTLPDNFETATTPMYDKFQVIRRSGSQLSMPTNNIHSVHSQVTPPQHFTQHYSNEATNNNAVSDAPKIGTARTYAYSAEPTIYSIFSFTAHRNDEINLNVGDTVRVRSRQDTDGWVQVCASTVIISHFCGNI